MTAFCFQIGDSYRSLDSSLDIVIPCIARSVKFEDKAKNLGADLVKQVAKATNTAAGDGDYST